MAARGGRRILPVNESELRVAMYEAQLLELRAENEQLRRSAQAFGELAERLSRALMKGAAADGQPGIASVRPATTRLIGQGPTRAEPGATADVG